jgi:hypothetical protein
MDITPKIAYVNTGSLVEDFLEEWEGNEDEAPTQTDYEEWLKHQLFATLCAGYITLDNIEVMEAPK